MAATFSGKPCISSTTTRSRRQPSAPSCSCSWQEQDNGKCSRRIGLVAPLLFGAGISLGISSYALSDEGPKLEHICYELRKVISKAKAPGLLRLVFHDAGTFNAANQSGGMNGSIVYELERPENGGLERSIKILNKARATLDTQVSWADLIAIAGSEAVKICGGPDISVRLGRLDSGVPDPEGELPSEKLNIDSLKQSFKTKGFSTQEMVVLSGAHTIGGKGFGNAAEFDNSYYDILLKKPWADKENKAAAMIGLSTDRMLVDDEECLRWLEIYRGDETRFFTDFSAVYTKMINLGAKWAVPLNMS